MTQAQFDEMLRLMRLACELFGAMAEDLPGDSPLGLRCRAKEASLERAVWALQDSDKYPAHKFAV